MSNLCGSGHIVPLGHRICYCGVIELGDNGRIFLSLQAQLQMKYGKHAIGIRQNVKRLKQLAQEKEAKRA